MIPKQSYKIIESSVHWNMTFIFPYIGNYHPNWLIFFRGIETTNQPIVDDDTPISGMAFAGQLRNDLTPLLFLEHYAVANRPVVLLEA